jgi:hypothetical protein
MYCKDFYTPSRNNLLDAMFMAAAALKINGRESCSDYTDEDIMNALRSYAVGQSSGTEFGEGGLEAHYDGVLDRISVCQ